MARRNRPKRAFAPLPERLEEVAGPSMLLPRAIVPFAIAIGAGGGERFGFRAPESQAFRRR